MNFIYIVFLFFLQDTTALTSPVIQDTVITEENPVTIAEDAFGTSIGGESIGLYQSSNVRGFNPVDAGNARLEGLYFDQISAFTGRLIRGSTILVGMSALSDPFPAPTGIVNARLRKPGNDLFLQLAPQINSFGGRQVEIAAEVPVLEDRLGFGGGIGFYEHEYHNGGDSSVKSLAFTPRLRQGEKWEVIPFWSYIDTRDMDVTPVFLTEGNYLPPEISRDRFLSQQWAGLDRKRQNYGLINNVRANGWLFKMGVFRSVEAPDRNYSILFLDMDPDGSAEFVAVSNPGQRFSSTSGEARLTRAFVSGSLSQRFHLSIRGRDQQRRFGGADRVELGSVQTDQPAQMPEPGFQFGDQTIDEVRHWTGSLAYEGHWDNRGEINVGIQKADYRKTVTPPEGPLPESTDTPWLYYGTVAVYLTPSVALFGGYTQGLEESPIAPESAINRDEAPPAIRSVQIDAGLRWQMMDGFKIIAAGFRLEKPYYAMDGEQLFRQLGEQRRRGIELSISGEPLQGLNVVAGTILMDAEVTGEEVEAGVVGNRPVGSTPSNIMTNLDYRLPFFSDLSLDFSVERSGKRTANVDNTLDVPATALVDAGARYRFRIGNSNGVLRVRMTNLFDTYTWNIAGSGAFSYNTPRQLIARITIDF